MTTSRKSPPPGAEPAADPARDRAAFLSALNHEIRTPLTGIVGLTRLLLDTKLDKMQRESLEVILQSGESLAGALDDLLDLARVDSGGMVVEASCFDVRGAVAGVVDLMVRGLGRGSGAGLAEVRVSVDPDVPDELSGDVVRLRRLILGALKAAAAAAPDTPLELAVGRLPGVLPGRMQLRLTFAGPDAALAAITKAFGEGDGQSGAFANLGLAVGRGMLRQLGGRLLRDRSGAVSLELPFGLVAAALPEPTVQPVVTGLRLLVAEDNAVNQRVARGLLERQGHEVVVVANGREALAAVQSQRFDLVLMDVQMPDMDGIEATMAIRALRGAAARVPIVALTANSFGSDRERCLAAGMNGVLGKPIRPDDLARVMAGVVAPAEPSHGETLSSLRDIFGPEEFERLLGVLLESLASGWAELAAAMGDQRLDVAAAAAHRIAGAAANFGFADLRTTAKRLEDAVDRGCSAVEATDLAAGLKAAIDRVEQAVQKMRTPA